MECRIEPKIGVVVVAGGKGVRMGGETPKQFRIIGQAPILAYSINALASAIKRAEIVVVLPKEHIEFWRNLSSRFEVAEHKIVEGGSERYHSVKFGIEALSEDIDIIAVHDGVRPLVSEELILRCVDCAAKLGSAVPVIPVTDSVRELTETSSRAIPRSTLRAVQTPQIFDAVLLKRAYRAEFKADITDDASAVEAMGQRVELCDGERRNIKITTEEDLIYADMILERDDERQDL